MLATSVSLAILAPSTSQTTEEGTGRSKPLDSASLDRENKALSQDLVCEERLPFKSDASFFDPARGTDCIRSDKRGVFVRVYAHAETIPHVLQEWEPTIGDDRWFVRGKNSIVMGPLDALTQAASMPGASKPSRSAATNVSYSAFDGDRDTCMSMLASAAAARTKRLSDYDVLRQDLDRAVPGASAVVEKTVTAEVIRSLKGKLDYHIDSALSRFGDQYREVCRRALPDR